MARKVQGRENQRSQRYAGGGLIKKANDRIEKKQRRLKKRTKLVGKEGVIKQNSRNFNEKVKGAFSKDDTVSKAKGREAVKRVGEYKKGKVTKMASGGQVCRGMGCATHGGKFGKDG
jgi:hypothetical protein